MAGFDHTDRAALSQGRRRSSRLSADGHAARTSAAELVRLQRPGDGRSAVRDHHSAPVCRAEPGAHPVSAPFTVEFVDGAVLFAQYRRGTPVTRRIAATEYS